MCPHPLPTNQALRVLTHALIGFSPGGTGCDCQRQKGIDTPCQD